MRLFIENRKNIQNDFFCLKIFTISLHSEKFPNIFHQEPKFIKKLLQFYKYNGNDKILKLLDVSLDPINYDYIKLIFLELNQLLSGGTHGPAGKFTFNKLVQVKKRVEQGINFLCEISRLA